MKIINPDKVDSTNSWVALHEGELPEEALVYSHIQTKGRGQKGNSWESAPGKNITASLLIHPKDFLASDQFLISEAVSLAIVSFLNRYGIEAEIKWPNDIYVGNKKICGILVENIILGKHITRSIAGFGINVNQKVFESDAPNPVSMSNITGMEYNIADLVETVAKDIEFYLGRIGDKEGVHEEYISRLWRNNGKKYGFYDRKAGEHIKAAIHSVAPSGILTLALECGDKREYAFKEVEYILSE